MSDLLVVDRDVVRIISAGQPGPPGTLTLAGLAPWSGATPYVGGELVTYLNRLYVALVASTNLIPAGNPGTWRLLDMETPEGAQAKADVAQAFARQRANHTGAQVAATISDFDAAVHSSRLDQMAAPTATVSFNGQRAVLLGDPVGPQDAATRAYIDNLRGAAGGVATLDGGGHIPQAQIPAVALATFLGDTASDAAMTALVAQPGDWTVRTDFDPDRAYMLNGADPTVLANWKRMTFGDVVSVNGQVGAVAGLVDTAGLGLVKVGAALRRAASTTGFANLAALPAAADHIGELQRTADGGIYESDGAAWQVVRDPDGTYPKAGWLDLNAKGFGAVGNGRNVADAAMDAGSHTLTSLTANFTMADVGKWVSVEGVGNLGGNLVTTIASWNSATSVELTDPAGTTKTTRNASLALTDDTAAIDLMFATIQTMVASGVGQPPRAFFPSGNYLYRGTGLDTTRIFLEGAGQGVCRINLAPTASFVKTDKLINSLEIRGFYFSGGYRPIWLYRGASNVQLSYVIENNNFRGYESVGCYLGFGDSPYWHVRNNTFRAANYINTMGLVGYFSDNCEVLDNHYVKNRVGIKTKCTNSRFRRNDFVRIDDVDTGAYPRIDIWFVPNVSIDSTWGTTVEDNKFGNEQRLQTDYFVLVADEDTSVGTDAGTWWPQLGADSTGYFVGVRFTENRIACDSANHPPFIYSTTARVQECHVDWICQSAAQPDQVIAYRTPPGASQASQGNTFGPFYGKDFASNSDAPVSVSNGVGLGHLIDPAYTMAAWPNEIRTGPGAGSRTGHVKLLGTGIRAFTLQASVTLANIVDSRGGSDAAELTFADVANEKASSSISALVAPTVGVPMWVEFDVAAGSATPISQFRVYVEYFDSSKMHWRRVIPVPVGLTWSRMRFPLVLREAASAITLRFSTDGVHTGKVKIGRVKVYHAREPVAFDYNTATTLRAVIDGGGAVIAVGAKQAYIPVPFDCRIVSARLLADQAGAAVVDIWKDSLANFPPTVADTITAAAKPTLAAARTYEDVVLNGWATDLTAGDLVEINVDSATTVTKLYVDLLVTPR